jgi:hypothetical protein
MEEESHPKAREGRNFKKLQCDRFVTAACGRVRKNDGETHRILRI